MTRSARPSTADLTARRAPSPVPLSPSDAPFRNLLLIAENEPGYLAEAKREIRVSAMRRLETLDGMYRQLVDQARQVVTAARRDLALHDLPLHGTKIRGQIYHLYEKPDDCGMRRFFSLLDATEHFQADPRATYLASYRLAEDSSWERVDGGTEEPWIEEQA